MSESQEQPIPTKPEISPLPIAGASKLRVDKSLQKPKGIQKKQLAARLMASAAIVATIGLKGDTVGRGLGAEAVATPPGIVQELSVQELEKRAEALYQIEILSPREVPVIHNWNDQYKTVEWTKTSLGVLMNNLEQLPTHFYSPYSEVEAELLRKLDEVPWSRPEGLPEEKWMKQIEDYNQRYYADHLDSIRRHNSDYFISREEFDDARKNGGIEYEVKGLPVSFVLVDTFPNKNQSGETEGQCLCDQNDSRADMVMFLHNVLEKSHSDRTHLTYLVHELTHHITKEEDEEFVGQLLFSDNIRSKEVMEYYKNHPNAWVGHRITDQRIRKQLGKTVIAKLDYATTNVFEFLAVGSEFYLEGRERFLEVYGQFIGEEKANKLYEYTRDNIFKGTEYKGYQIERKP